MVITNGDNGYNDITKGDNDITKSYNDITNDITNGYREYN